MLLFANKYGAVCTLNLHCWIFQLRAYLGLHYIGFCNCFPWESGNLLHKQFFVELQCQLYEFGSEYHIWLCDCGAIGILFFTSVFGHECQPCTFLVHVGLFTLHFHSKLRKCPLHCFQSYLVTLQVIISWVCMVWCTNINGSFGNCLFSSSYDRQGFVHISLCAFDECDGKGQLFFIMFMLRSKGGDVLYLASPHIDGFWFLILSRDHTSPISMAQLLAAFLIHHNTLLSVITEKVWGL